MDAVHARRHAKVGIRLAPGRLRVPGFKRLLTDDDRRKIADDVIPQLRSIAAYAVTVERFRNGRT
jgi:hypothetical protein